MRNTRSRKTLFSFWFPVVLIAAVAAVSHVQMGVARAEAGDDEDPVAKITQLNRDAIGAYQAKKYEDARKLLKQALDVASAAALDQHPIKARTHVHMGVVIIVGFKQRDVGIKQFRKALDIQPDILLTKGLVTPDLQAAFDQAIADGKGGGGAAAAAGGGGNPPPEPAAPAAPPAAPAATPPEAPANGLVHEPVTEGKQGSAISISVAVQSDLDFDKLVLAYRPDGAADFLGRQMKQVSEGTYAAEIPTSATGGRSVAYYIEAEDKDGGPVASRGSADSPITISLAGGSGRAPVARKSSDGDDDDDDDDDEGPDTRWFVALMAGSGAGWASGNGDTNADRMISPAGFAGALAGHFAPEVGYWLRENLMLSLQGRFQAVTGTTDLYQGAGSTQKIYHTANYAAAVLAKATYRFGSGNLRPMVSFAAGGGQIRHVVTYKRMLECGPMRNVACVDTISAGPVIVGPGAGVLWSINEHFGLLAQVNTQLAFSKFTFNIDGNVGAALSF